MRESSPRSHHSSVRRVRGVTPLDDEAFLLQGGERPFDGGDFQRQRRGEPRCADRSQSLDPAADDLAQRELRIAAFLGRDGLDRRI